MSRSVCLFVVFVLLLSIPVYAQEPHDLGAVVEYDYSFEYGLNIRIDAIGDRRRVYTAVTDLHGLDILTVHSSELEQAYRELVVFRRRQSVDALFEFESIVFTESERVIMRSEELGLFRLDGDEVFLRSPATDMYEQINVVLYVAIVIVLCVTAFFVSSHLRGRKRRKKEQSPLC